MEMLCSSSCSKLGFCLVFSSRVLMLVLSIRLDIHLKHPEQHLLRGKQLFKLRNLLHNRKPEDSGRFLYALVFISCYGSLSPMLFVVLDLSVF